MLSKTLGQRIRELRTKKGLSQIELAEGICTPSMVSQCESDRARPSYRILSAFAEKLDIPLDSLLTNIDLQLEFTSNYKMIRSMIAAKEYGAAIPLLKDLFASPRNLVTRSEILLLLAECYLRTGDFENAEIALVQLKEDCIAEKNSHMLSVVYNLYGLMESDRKQYEVAVYHFENALEEANKALVPDLYVQAEIYMNLGHVRDMQGKLKMAIEMYAQAQKLYAEKQTPHEMAHVYAGLARSYQRLHEHEKSIEYSDLAYSLFKTVENMYMGAKVQLTYAIAIGQCGNEVEAIQTLETVIMKFQELGKTEDVGIAYTELAKMQLAFDDTERAEESCSIARSLLPEMHLYQAWVNRTLGEIAVKRGDQNEAIRRLQMAGDCFKLLGEIGAWADTMSNLSQLKMERNDTTGALAILQNVQKETRKALSDRGIVL